MKLILLEKNIKTLFLKPLYGNGGNGIFFLDEKDKNFNSLIEIFLDSHPEQFILQEYLPNIKFGDKRIILINGKPEGAINRIQVKMILELIFMWEEKQQKQLFQIKRWKFVKLLDLS